MTKETCLRLLKHYEKIGHTQGYEDMKQHMLKGKKFSTQETDAIFKKPVEKSHGKK